MIFKETGIPGLLIIEPGIYRDNRGYFYESYNARELEKAGIKEKFIQDNQSKSAYGVIRGLHYQLEPYAQTKLLRVLEGRIYDVAVDVREGSPAYGQWFGLEISSENSLQFYIPKGFAHGFSVLSETAVVLYKCDSYYNPSSEAGIIYNDDSLDIDWKIKPGKEIISPKDTNLPPFEKAELNFKFAG
jgi:dTDP-4-dehydrorhamnose 3,5-epimerase